MKDKLDINSLNRKEGQCTCSAGQRLGSGAGQTELTL